MGKVCIAAQRDGLSVPVEVASQEGTKTAASHEMYTQMQLTYISKEGKQM